MRARVAAHSGGHAFEERFLNLDPAQLSVLFLQTLEEDKRKDRKTVELVKSIKEVFFKKLDYMTESLQMFSNVKMFKAMMDLKDTEKHRQEIKPEDFNEEWEKLMEVIPEEYIIEEPTSNLEAQMMKSDNAPPDEIDDLLSGWVEKSWKHRED